MYPHLEGLPEGELGWFDALVRLARYLRSPNGCPWDRKQTAQDFARFAIEEGRELEEAFAQKDNNEIEEYRVNMEIIFLLDE